MASVFMQELFYKISEVFLNNTDVGEVFVCLFGFYHGVLEGYWTTAF